ncbi:UDP-galactose transporter [Ostertagia ostertagi]
MIVKRLCFRGLAQIYDQFVHHWRDALKVLVPAVVYTIQNFLLYVAVENLPAATYMVTYQLKILTTAVFTVLVLGRKLSIQQDQKMSNDREKAERLAAAMANDISTTAMPTIEDAFTKLMDSTPEMFNDTTLAPAALDEIARPKREVKDNSVIFADGIAPEAVWGRMLFGFDWAVWVTIAISAFGGLVVAVVIKFADNILKAFATSFAIVLNCILAYFLFNFRPTMFFVVGACFVIGAVFVYSIYPYRVRSEPRPTAEEMTALKESNEKEAV